ncbi:MAG: hypothetical protein ACM3PC_09415 [Deltaproteobacteria bacterium]
MSQAAETACPHCGGKLERFGLPEAIFDHAWDFACFNDDCPYYVRGWAWMEQEYGVKASYRHRVDSRTGQSSPLAVYSPFAFRSSILPPEEQS